ncbi:universal stress protein [Haloarcula pelagica]|uniref:universal stress protein n=1 Tax=Haloarcula pelagica TaxID=3033389 RepID=UPI0024C238A3|nr:universal stress protein [Halomicroarcula sp. YJ-61-S]
MYDRILLPTDGTAGMDGVVRHAAALAATHGAEIHALYVVDTARFSTLPAGMTWEGLTDMFQTEGERAMDAVERQAGDVPVQRAIVEGRPSTEIGEYARTNDCDVIVMGTHGRGGIDRLLLGSVAENVIRAARIPVVTVPVEAADRDPPTDRREVAAE